MKEQNARIYYNETLCFYKFCKQYKVVTWEWKADPNTSGGTCVFLLKVNVDWNSISASNMYNPQRLIMWKFGNKRKGW